MKNFTASTTVEDFYDQQHDPNSADPFDYLLIFDSAIRYSYSLLGNLPGKKLLEIGCGSGRQSRYFVAAGAQVLAIDVSQKCVQALQSWAQEQKIPLSSLTAQVLTAENIKCKDNTFDAIYINSVLMHADPKKVLKECRRVLKPGGKVVVVEPLQHNPVAMIYRLFSDYQKTNPKYLTLRKFRQFQTGFASFHHHEFYFFSLCSLPFFRYGATKKMALKVSCLLEKADSLLLKLVPFFGQFYWVSVVEYRK